MICFSVRDTNLTLNIIIVIICLFLHSADCNPSPDTAGSYTTNTKGNTKGILYTPTIDLDDQTNNSIDFSLRIEIQPHPPLLLINSLNISYDSISSSDPAHGNT